MRMRQRISDGLRKTRRFVRDNKYELIQMGVLVAVTAIGGDCSANDASKGMPWSTGINTLKGELTGPIPTIGATVACATSGAMLAFGETSGITKKAIQGTFGMGIATGAGSLVTTLTSAGSGCMF